jgi:hypothetical protein
MHFNVISYAFTCIFVEQGRIKGFLDPRHFSSLGPLGDSKELLELKCTLDYPG